MIMNRLLIILMSMATICSCMQQKEQTVSIENQRIDLPGVANARQFGGYEIGGRKVKKDVLLRTGNLSQASDEAIASLENHYKLGVVFDFRSSFEHNAAPDRKVEGCREVWLPCLESLMSAARASGGVSEDMNPGDVNELAQSLLEHAKDTTMAKMGEAMYPLLAFEEENRKSYSEFLDSLAVLPEGRAALWHCSQGKDRCGFGSAMVLAALGADKDLIIRDFALSNESYADLLDKIVGKAREMDYSDAEINTIYMLVGVSVDNFSKTMDMIEQRYGSLDEYLTTALDCDEEQRAMLRARFLE